VQTRIEALYGARPTRADVTSIALKLGGRLGGEWVVREGSEEHVLAIGSSRERTTGVGDA
jgi:hypothetical protein